MSEERAKFGSKIGMILATAGGAVGLGNVWRFPYMTGEHGGAAFILVYLGCVLLLGIPCMISEFIIGRHGAANTYRAYAKLSGGKAWKYVGLLGVMTGFLIMGYYAVVSAWCLHYIYASGVGLLHGDPAYVSQYFQKFSTDPVQPLFWTALILLATYYVIIHGVRGGIERASKLFMPTLFILLLVIVVASCMLPGAGKGITFLFKPDFSKLDSDVFLGALGQSFYSLSIAMGCICTYASYYSRQTNLLRSAVEVASVDTLVAILAGLMIFPAAFSVGIQPDAGPALIFITLPQVFMNMAGGRLWGTLFFLFMTFASFSTVIAVFENLITCARDNLGWSRTKSVVINCVFILVASIPCVLGYNIWSDLHLIGARDVLDSEDFLVSNILLPLGALVYLLFCTWKSGWGFDKYLAEANTGKGLKMSPKWKAYLRYALPVLILLIFIEGLL